MRTVELKDGGPNITEIRPSQLLDQERGKSFWTESSAFLMLQESAMQGKGEESHFLLCSHFFNSVLS